MKRYLFKPAVLIAVPLILLTACAQNVGVSTTEAQDQASTAASRPTFAQFQDIPIPNGATMNATESLIFGDRDAWIGRLVLNATFTTSSLFDFYKQQTVEFGWSEITSVRSEVSVLTFERDERVLTVQIRRNALAGSTVNVTVSPRGGSGGTANASVTNFSPPR